MKSRNKIVLSLIAAGSAFALLLSSQSNSSPHSPRVIAILQTAQHSALDANYKGIVDGLEALSKEIGPIRIDYQVAQGTLIAAQMAQKFVSESPSLLVGIGTGASQALLAADPKRRLPIIFTTVTDPLLAKLVKSPPLSAQKVTGVSNFVPSDPQFEAFKKICPSLRRLGIIYNPAEANSHFLLQEMKAKSGELQLVEMAATSTQEVASSALALSSGVDAIFINNDNTALAAFDSIVRAAKAASIPLFCSDADMISRGALACLGPDQYLLGQQTAAMIGRVLQGEDPSMALELPHQVQLHINLDVAADLGLIIDPLLLEKARLYSKKTRTDSDAMQSSSKGNQP